VTPSRSSRKASRKTKASWKTAATDFRSPDFVARSQRFFFPILSAALTLLLYWRSFHSPFVYDDLDQIVNNPNLGTWSQFVQRFLLRPVELTTSFLGYGGSTYRPVFWLSIFIDHALWKLNPEGFHVTNVALHLLNANLVFALLRRLQISFREAAVISLLWLSLPVNTEVVAWVSGRAYALCTFFILLCLLSALAFLRRGGFVSALTCFVTATCAVLSHELGLLILPLFLLLVISTGRKWNKTVFTTAGILSLTALIYETLRLRIGVHALSRPASIKWAAIALWQYVTITLLPLHMSVERSTSISLNQPHPWLMPEVGCMALIFGYAVWCRRTNPALLGGLAWFAICTAPFWLLINYQGTAERFAYLGAIGIIVAIVSACSTADRRWARTLVAICLGTWSLWNVYKTSVRLGDWSDPVRLYQSSLQATPLSPSLHYSLAFSLRERGDLKEALSEYQRTLEIDDKYPHGFASLGDLYLQLNSYSPAQTAFGRALAIDPNDTAVLLNKGAAYQSAGALSDAEAVYKRISQIEPANSAAHVNLGVLYLSEKRQEDAMHEFAQAIDLKSKDTVPYYDLAVLFQQAGRFDLALVLYKKVLELKPDDEDTLRNIGIIQKAQ
jgi:protein O-mannosyl-transferase